MAVLELDYAAGEIGIPLEPDIDDLNTHNDVTAARRDGSSARAVDNDGPLGVDAIGLRKTQVDVNPADENALANHAYWHLALGMVEDARWSQVTVDLAAAPHLVAAAAAVDVGDLIRLINLPDDLVPDMAELIITGNREEVFSHRRFIIFNTVQARIYQQTGVYGTDAVVSRYDSANSRLVAGVDTDDTSLLVVTDHGHARWVVGNSVDDSPTFPIDFECSGIRLPTTEIAPAILDEFGRTVSSGWGTEPTTGLTWAVVSGTAADHAVASGRARHNMNTRNVNYIDLIDLGVAPDVLDVYLPIRPGVVALTADFRVAIELRSSNSSNDWARWDVEFRTSGVLAARHRRQIGGVQTNFSYVAFLFTYGASDVLWSRFLLDGDDMYGKLWLTNLADEPDDWSAIELGGAAGVPSGTQMGVRTFINSANTNTLPRLVEFDEFQLANPQRFTVQRNVDGIDKALAAGAQVSLSDEARYGL